MNTMLPTFFSITPIVTYVGWFGVLYFIASYVRLYPKKIFQNKKVWGMAFLFSLIFACGSIFVMALEYQRNGNNNFYYFVKDVNKIFAVTTSFTMFIFFKNINLKYSPVINKLAASAFGVFLIHANSDSMRNWLWKDMLKNVEFFKTNYLIPHAIISVILIYLVASLIDMLRIYFVERPVLEWYDKNNIETKFMNWWNGKEVIKLEK